MKHSAVKGNVNTSTDLILKRFYSMPRQCLNDSIQSYFIDNYLMVKPSNNAIIIAEIKGNFIYYHRFDFN